MAAAVAAEPIGPPATSSHSHSMTASKVVDATNRGLDDIHAPTWLLFTTTTSLIGFSIQYPAYLAMTRRQANPQLENKTTVRLLADMYHANGRSPKVWFRGLPSLLVGIAGAEIGYLWTYEWFRNKNGSSPLVDLFGGREAASQAALDGTAGFIADAITTVGYVPFAVIANRQMCAGVGVAASMKYESALTTWKHATNGPQGARGMFVGLSPSLLMSTHSFYWWAVYGTLKERLYAAARPHLPALEEKCPWLPRLAVSQKDNVVLNCMAAIVAGTSTAVIWNPVAVVRTRMQVAVSASENGVHVAAPRMRDVFASVWKQEGVRGFMKGSCVAAATAVVEASLFATIYETGKFVAQEGNI
jgi:hypothetical protein